MNIHISATTNGKGFWTRVVKKVDITSIDVAYVNETNTFGELRAYFTPESWDVERDGLIYSDMHWLYGFRNQLVLRGFSASAALDVNFSEQGMQGDNYVSMDVGEKFLSEWVKFSK